MNATPCRKCGGTERNSYGRCRGCQRAAEKRYEARRRQSNSAEPRVMVRNQTGKCQECGTPSSSWFCSPSCFATFTSQVKLPSVASLRGAALRKAEAK